MPASLVYYVLDATEEDVSKGLKAETAGFSGLAEQQGEAPFSPFS
jgi:hypothetical protein